MKKIYTATFLLIFLSGTVAAQTTRPRQTPAAAPLPTREVSGIVKDSIDQAIIGATITLTSSNDTLRVSTNADGIFVFKKVKSPEFTISAKLLGYRLYVKKFFYPYTNARLVLDPLILHQESTLMTEVVVNGTPAITYKTDTVEYRASDYKVRENATMEELLKKMEGIEVDKDGNVTAQGIAITRARVNGRNYSGSDVAGVIRELPAEIAEKIQIIDDYGDQAELTGIKDGEPQKVLNIVTRRDKSVSNRANLAGSKGNNGRYSITAGANRQNANQQIRLTSTFNNTVTGIAGSTGGGGNFGGGGNGGGPGGGGAGSGSEGTNRRGSAGFSYSDDLSAKLRINGGYTYNFRDQNAISNSFSSQTLKKKGTTTEQIQIYSARTGTSDNSSRGHQLEGRIDYRPSKVTSIIFTPTFNYNKSGSSSINKVLQTGSLYQDQEGKNGASGTTPNYNFNLNAAHRFSTKTNASVQLSAANSGNEQERENRINILYYNPNSVAHELLNDSLVNRLINTDNETANYRASSTFSQGFGSVSRIELNTQVSYRGYDNNQIVNDVINNQPSVRVDRLSKIFNYSFTETRIALNYRRGNNSSKVNFSLGLTAVPSVLKGSSETLHNTTERRSFNLVPITRVQYKWTNQKSVSLNYSGRAQEPSFDQIQDVPDESNPTNPIIGNPKLKPSFNHTIQGNFNNYMAKSRITIQTGLTANYSQNQVIRNTILLDDVYGSFKRETRFINKSGNYSYRGNYSFGKRFPNNTYGIKLDGDVRNAYSISMNDGSENVRTSWQFNERLTLLVSPKDWLEINPFISHDFNKSNFSLPGSNDSRVKNWSMNVDGRFIIKKTLLIGYDVSKNFVSGLNANINSNPFIINSYITKEFFKRKNGSISLRSYDLFNQNNFTNRQITDNGYTDTKTNALSRYFTVGFSWRPSKYTGGSGRTGGARRGDGSFIVN